MLSMRNLYTIPLLAAVFLFFSGCGTTSQVGMSNALPSVTQLRLNTAEEFETDFAFSGHPEGDKVKISTSTSATVYDLNGVLEGRLTQLLRSKFGSINPSSDNKISVSVDRIETENDTRAFSSGGTHQVSVEVGVEITREGETFTRTISRSAQIDAKQTGELVPKTVVDEAQLEEFIMQFVVGTDSFIDSNFGVD
jgi:hypothetical protein